ncbi:histidine phosphatase family protein [Gillisia sp. M10.2A]|uniref:Histidine phosphatase family protein n=1 Tax=Gillisia lutea TaxID=2909668 RepID=A0ABS9EIH6_9FLAO|nr:phosphoglycerate mutase family protein [Gillisia lutea]MCF4101251.1 histidine phosphatase family protein [Gillisia lutea]
MKYLLLLLFPLLTICGQNSNENQQATLNQDETSGITTYYLIRHAEKDRSDAKEKDPVLNAEGLKRAENWANVLKDIPLDLIYSTNYKRTKATAAPTAKLKLLEIKLYDPKKLYNSDFKKATKGKNVLVVGHSDTTPAFVNAILGSKKYLDFDDSENGALFIITVNADGNTTSQVLYIN